MNAPRPRRIHDAPLTEWFATRGWKPLPFQREAWRRYRAGESGLIVTPTGSGKTLAAFGGPLLEGWHALRERASPRLRLLWITPLRALAADTVLALRTAIDALGLDWTVALRTGDASSRDRRLARRGEAEVLVTTPESLALLLSYPETGDLAAALRAVIVDEWHELLGSKRGVLLQLGLARLRAWSPSLRIWGLSATIDNLEEARDVLLPHVAQPALVTNAAARPVELVTLLPAPGERFPWAGHLGLSQLARVVDRVHEARSTLLFANTRAHAELWHRALQAIWTGDADEVALHHGSLSTKLRAEAEQGLRDGRIRCVVATSSLDLGVDFPAVDQVMQIGSPKGVARLVQRAGRARHRPGESGRIVCVPTHLLELVEYAATRRALAAGHLEARPPLRRCLDVLAQHCVTLALADGFDADALYAEVRGTHAYGDLARSEWQAVLDFIVQGGAALEHYPDYRRVVRDGDGRYRVHERRVAFRHRLSIGTITAHGQVSVKFAKGGTLGAIEEEFVLRLRPRDRFQFAGRTLELVQVRDQVAYVRLARRADGAVPRWMGGRLPLSTALAREVEATLADPPDGPEMRRAEPLRALQSRLSALPSPEALLAEFVRDRDGAQLALYPFAGRAVHEGLAAVLALRWSRRRPNTIAFTVNDYCLMLSAQATADIDVGTLRDLLTRDALEADLREAVNLAALARRQFRDIARIAGLLTPSLPGRAARSLRQLQASSGLLFDVLARHDPDHLLLAQAEREVLTQVLDLPALRAALERCAACAIVLQHPPSLTPLSFPLWAEFRRGQLSNEDWSVRVRRAAERLEKRHG